MSDDPRNVVSIAFTGGIDSTALLYAMAGDRRTDKIYLLTADYGQANAEKSKELAEYHSNQLAGPTLGVCMVDIIGAGKIMPDDHPLATVGYVPADKDAAPDTPYPTEEQKLSYGYAFVEGRNAILFLQMARHCVTRDVRHLFTGHQLEPTEWRDYDSYRHRTEDFGPRFVDRMNLLLEVGFSKPVRIEAPFIAGRFSKEDIVNVALDNGLSPETLIERTYSCQFWPECKKCDNCVNRRLTFERLGW